MAQDIITIESILFNENLALGSTVTYQDKPLVVGPKRVCFNRDGAVTEFTFTFVTPEEYAELKREVVIDDAGRVISDLLVTSNG